MIPLFRRSDPEAVAVGVGILKAALLLVSDGAADGSIFSDENDVERVGSIDAEADAEVDVGAGAGTGDDVLCSAFVMSRISRSVYGLLMLRVVVGCGVADDDDEEEGRCCCS